MFVPSTFSRIIAPRIGFQSLQSTFCNKPQPENQKIIELGDQFFKVQTEEYKNNKRTFETIHKDIVGSPFYNAILVVLFCVSITGFFNDKAFNRDYY